MEKRENKIARGHIKRQAANFQVLDFKSQFSIWILCMVYDKHRKNSKICQSKILMYKLCYETFQHILNFNIPYIAMCFILLLLYKNYVPNFGCRSYSIVS